MSVAYRLRIRGPDMAYSKSACRLRRCALVRGHAPAQLAALQTRCAGGIGLAELRGGGSTLKRRAGQTRIRKTEKTYSRKAGC